MANAYENWGIFVGNQWEVVHYHDKNISIKYHIWLSNKYYKFDERVRKNIGLGCQMSQIFNQGLVKKKINLDKK